MQPKFEYGHQVRVVRTLRDDGTFPGRQPGDILVRAGAVGYVRNVGTFLQDQVIYAVHFVREDITVGCREDELIDLHDPWLPARFIFRDKVINTRAFAVAGQVVTPRGESGEIERVLRTAEGGPQYYVRFGTRTFLAPETSLDFDPAYHSADELLPATEGAAP